MKSTPCPPPSELERVETPRLVLTAHALVDFACFLYEPARFAKRFDLTNVPSPLDSETQDGLTRRYDASCHLDDDQLIWGNIWSVVTREERLFVGVFCFKGIPEGGDAELAYYVEEPFRNRGYMTETLRAVVDWARRRDDVSGLTAETLLTNVASQRALVKAGFKPYPNAPDPAADSCWLRIDLKSTPY